MIDESRLYLAIGQRIKKLREGQLGARKKLTQAKLAAEIGLERTSITNIEQGNQKVPLHVIYRICEALEAPITDILPSLSEVNAVFETDVKEVSIGQNTVSAPPLVAEALKRFLNQAETHAN